ncbi:MAG: GWxTD domain-containing protein [Candidatus Aminicenantes bacterium]
MRKYTLFFITVIIMAMLCSVMIRAEKKSPKDLPEIYRVWLEEEVVYIITQNERDVFLQLESDRERDMFIEAFWKQRDPNPELPGNKFKEEHYRRIKHANQVFGREAPGPGWRTARGRIFIILGDPDYIERYESDSEIYPTIIWFYEGMAEYGLPNSFNVVFFKRGGMGEYELYSPIKFGPQHLLSRYRGDPTDYRTAYRKLMNIEPSVARISLTLIPTEIQYITSPSIASEILLSQMIPEAPHEKVKDTYAKKLLKYKDFIEVDYSANYIESDAMVRVIQDESGMFFVHYLIEPSKFSVEGVENSYFSNFEVNGSITNSEGKTIYQYERKVPIELTPSQLKNIRQKLFSFQDLFPLIEGSYRLDLLMKNTVSKEFTSFEVSLNIPGSSSLIMSDLTLANRAVENSKYQGNIKPFLFRDTQLVPSPRNDFCKDETLYLFFQVFGLNKKLAQEGILRYTLFKEDEEVRSFNKDITAYADKTYFIEEFPLADYSPANYRIKVSLLDSKKNEVLSSQNYFYISPFENLPRPWVVSFPMPSSDDPMYANILGLQAKNAGNSDQARSLLEKAYNENPASPKYGLDLAQFLFENKEFQRAKQISLPFVEREQNEFLSVLARSFQALKEYEQAIHYYKEYLSHYGTHIPILNSVGECYYSLGNLKEALTAWERSLEINPNQEDLKNTVESIKRNQKK